MKVLCFIGGVNMLILTCENGIGPLVGFIKSALTLVQIFIPIALIIWGTIDLGKAVIASKEDEIKKNQQNISKESYFSIVSLFSSNNCISINGVCWK